MTVPACAALLREHFPALFAGKPKPLKLRIQVDIQERTPGLFPKQSLSAFLRRYTMSDAYLRAVAAGTHRYDLDGQPVAELSEEHRKLANDTLSQRRSQGDARRQQEQEQRNFRAGLLRDFEGTTLTRENFCALKGIDPAGLDEQLELARRERSERQQFQTELVAGFRAAENNLVAYANQKRMHPVQLERLLREAGVRFGPPPRDRERGQQERGPGARRQEGERGPRQGQRADRPRGDRPAQQGERPPRGERQGPADRPPRGERAGQADRPARGERSAQGERPPRGERPAQGDRPPRAERAGPGAQAAPKQPAEAPPPTDLPAASEPAQDRPVPPAGAQPPQDH
ncbi:ProQ/FINO family protein [Aquabacterium sp. A7-Y]|uniref:ProQ/FINO family protein n=1 Tax=Aquabacterium sp. A7-Y TaxID=1349605 RepID=UPI00223DAEF2|nr:ProQ/FINO family protein [Aquabacterium sp. A7-Y]MCW7536588.1 ProQ/FINO family protein [Aquabacterium sp. A7-Y]